MKSTRARSGDDPTRGRKVLWGGVRRVVQIARAMVRHGLAHAVGGRIDRLPPSLARQLRRRLPKVGLPGPERLRMLFEDIGGTFIKFGQMLALQPDIVPLETCNALFNLLDRVQPFSYAEIERTLAEELGRAPSEVFEAFDPEPLATASVGQVHAARFDGRKVAVKVQRPNVESEFQSDVQLMVATMSLIRSLRLKPLYWLIEPMSEFVSWTREELDYRYEARYSEELRSTAVDTAKQYVPRVFGELTTRRVLVVEFLEGVTVLAYLRAREQGDEVLVKRLENLGFDRRRFAANVIENFLGNAFRLGIYHADLHPANLMILADSAVGYVDFGITGMLSPYSRRHLMMMTLALARGDLACLAAEFIQLTVPTPTSDPGGFRRGLEKLAEGWYEGEGDGRRLTANFTRIMTEMLQLSRTTKVMPERDIVKYIRSSIAIDGLVTRFEIDFDLGAYLAEACARHLDWSARRELFSVERMLSWSSASGRLWQDGLSRGARVLDRLASGELPAQIELEDGERGTETALRARAVQLAAAAFGVSVLVVVGGEPVQLGINLASAELIFLAVALALLTGTLRRLVW